MKLRTKYGSSCVRNYAKVALKIATVVDETAFIINERSIGSIFSWDLRNFPNRDLVYLHFFFTHRIYVEIFIVASVVDCKLIAKLRGETCFPSVLYDKERTLSATETIFIASSLAGGRAD